MNQNFKILNDFKGFGNPNGKYWFVGIEEAASIDNDDRLREIIKVYSKEYIPVLKGSIQKDTQKLGRKYTQVYDIMSKIIVELEDKKVSWKEYRNTKLLQENSNEFQMNLFPLGKKNTNDWLDCYQKWFEFKNKQDYISYVVNTRFKLLREFHKHKNPKFTICFGISYSDYFKSAFNLKNRCITINGIELYENERFLITPFFDNRNMGCKKIHETVELAKRIINIKSKL